MERLTSNKNVSDMSMTELAHNCCYAENRKARYRCYDMDIDAREFARALMHRYAGENMATKDEEFDEEITEYLADEPIERIGGLIAVFYSNLWAMANLRERLKYYEDLEEQGKLLKLPCAVGDTVFRVNESVIPMIVIGVAIRNENELVLQTKEINYGGENLYKNSSIGKTVFLTREDAETALKKLRG